MPDIPHHPKIWGDLRLDQLHITGASYATIGDAPSVPTKLILGHKTRRWTLSVVEVVETDKTGTRLGPGPASTPPAPVMKDYQKVLDLLAEERKEREGLYPVIDEMKRVRALLEAELASAVKQREEAEAADGELLADREAAIKAFEKENAKLRLQEKQNQAEVCAACRKAAEDTANGVPLPPDDEEGS